MSYRYGLLVVTVLFLILSSCNIGTARAAGYWVGGHTDLFRIAPGPNGKLTMTTTAQLYGAKVGVHYPVRSGPLGIVVELPDKKLGGWFAPDGRRIFWQAKTPNWVKQRV